MKVHIEGQLYLESDSMQFILKEYTGNKDKHERETFKTLGFYTNIKSALNAVIKQKIMQSTAQTLLELHEEIKRIEYAVNNGFDWNSAQPIGGVDIETTA
jgi:hypothetical protein